MTTVRHALLALTQDPGLMETLRAVLGADQPLEQTGSPQEAVEQAQTGSLGLVLLDSSLEGLDAGALCLQLKKDPRTSRLPVLVLVPSGEEAVRAVQEGASDVLLGPLDPVVTRNRIRNYVDFGRCIEALQKFSLIDGVTGIANRHRFDEFLALEWRRNSRNHTPLSIVLMDLDHFRAYTEHYGPAQGDACLKEVATAFQEATQRPGDLVAFYTRGGFACILPETDNLGAVSVAERLRAELATLAIPHETSDTAPTLTMSVGTATQIPAPGLEPEDLVASAEHALREAKRAGRNRVVFGG